MFYTSLRRIKTSGNIDKDPFYGSPSLYEILHNSKIYLCYFSYKSWSTGFIVFCRGVGALCLYKINSRIEQD